MEWGRWGVFFFSPSFPISFFMASSFHLSIPLCVAVYSFAAVWFVLSGSSPSPKMNRLLETIGRIINGGITGDANC